VAETIVGWILGWIEGGALNIWILETYWLWPTLEILHFFGLSLLLGALLIVDLRLAGFFRQLDMQATLELLPWGVLGFLINLVTGVLFFFGDPARYSINIGFQIKMLLIVIAGFNTLWYILKIKPQQPAWAAGANTPASAKTVAWVSLSAWTGVLLCGRLIPYVGTG